MNDRGTRRWWAVGALALSGVVIGVDATVLSLALPNLAIDLHASTSQLQWVVDAYLLFLGALMLPAGLLGDRFGRKRLLVGALALFAVGSLACAYATSAAQLIAARALLGLAAAFVLPLSLSVLPVLFDEHERQRALAAVASAAVAAYPLGPILGGWLLTHFWWGSVFLINVPVIALALLAVGLLMPEPRGAARVPLDPVGVLLSTGGLGAVTYGLIAAGDRGWGNGPALAWMLAGAVALVGFTAWESRRTRVARLVDLSLFSSRGFTWGVVLATMLSFALIGLLFTTPQYFRAVLGVDAMGAGVRLLPMIGGLVVGLVAGDRVSRKAGAKVTVAIGFAAAATGLGMGAFTGTGSGSGFAATWLAIAGFGTGVVLPAAINAALSQLSAERSGVGSALVQAVRQIGGTFGVAVLGSVLNSAYRGRLHLEGLPAPAAGAVRDGVTGGVAVAHRLGSAPLLEMVRVAFVHGMDVLLAVSAVLAAAGAVLALLFLPGTTRAPTAAPPTPDVAVPAGLREPA